MQIYFHSCLWSYLPRVPILVEDTVYIYIYIYIYILGLCIGKNLAIRYVSRYRGCDTIYCDTLRYCKQGDILGYFLF